MTTYADGLFQYGGQPVGSLGVSVPNRSAVQGSGGVFFVDQTNGADGNPGTSPLLPLATIQRAFDLCADGGGNTVFVMAGSYDENLTVTKDYVSLIGVTIGGYARPDIVPASGVPLTVTGQGFTCQHVRFAPTGADPVDQQGNGFSYVDCVFDGDGTAAKGYRLLPSSTDTHLTASEGEIAYNLFRGNAVGLIFDTGAAPVGVGSSDNWIHHNRFYSNTLDIATADAGSGLYSAQLTNVTDNFFADKNKATYIDLTTTNGGAASAQTGTFARNGFASDTMTTTKIKAVGTGFTFMGNYDTVGIFDGSGLD